MQLLSRALPAQLYEYFSVISESAILYEHVDTLIVHVIICTHWVDNLYKNSNNILSSYLLSFVSFELNLFSFFFFWCFSRFANLEWYFHITTIIRSALCLILFWINFFYSHSVPSCMTYINCVQLSLAFFHEVLTLPFTQSIASRQFVFAKIYGHYT